MESRAMRYGLPLTLHPEHALSPPPSPAEKVAIGSEKVAARRETSRDVSVALENTAETAVSRHLATFNADLGSAAPKA